MSIAATSIGTPPGYTKEWKTRRLTVTLTAVVDVPDERIASVYAEDALNRALVLGLADGVGPLTKSLDLIANPHGDEARTLPATVTMTANNEFLP